jgi:hypothetical protein
MGSDPRVSDTQLYRLRDHGNVTIAVTIGDAQVGETTLQLKGATTHLRLPDAALRQRAGPARS